MLIGVHWYLSAPSATCWCPSVPVSPRHCLVLPIGDPRWPSVPGGTQQCPWVPIGPQWYPAVPVGAHQSSVVPSDARQCPVTPTGARWPCACPVPPCPSPAVAAGPLALLPAVAADQCPDEEPEQAEEQEGAQDRAHDDARLPSSCHGSTACHRRPSRRLPTRHHAPGGTLALRASPRQHPARAVSPLWWHLLGARLRLIWHTE